MPGPQSWSPAGSPRRSPASCRSSQAFCPARQCRRSRPLCRRQFSCRSVPDRIAKHRRGCSRLQRHTVFFSVDMSAPSARGRARLVGCARRPEYLFGDQVHAFKHCRLPLSVPRRAGNFVSRDRASIRVQAPRVRLLPSAFLPLSARFEVPGRCNVVRRTPQGLFSLFWGQGGEFFMIRDRFVTSRENRHKLIPQIRQIFIPLTSLAEIAAQG